ncbi:MAG: plastocyanin/azurin family copper-binding protein [Chloroflexota bacterium]
MRLAIRLIGPAMLLSVLAVGCASQPASSPAPAAAGTQISIKGFAFNPNQPSVTKGATITWTNDDGATHTVTSGVPGTPSGKFDQRVEAGKTFAFTFSDAGTYEFFCSIHNSMRGTVTVK